MAVGHHFLGERVTVMMDFSLIFGPIMLTAIAFLMSMHVGYRVGSMHDIKQAGIGTLLLCIFAVLAQGTLWVLWALRASGVI